MQSLDKPPYKLEYGQVITFTFKYNYVWHLIIYMTVPWMRNYRLQEAMDLITNSSRR